MYYVLEWQVDGAKEVKVFNEDELFPELQGFLESLTRLHIPFQLEGKLRVP